MTLAELKASIAASSLAFVVTDPRQADNPIVALNEEFYHLTGHGEASAIGRNPRFLQGPETDRATVAHVHTAIAAGQAVFTEVLNYRIDGSAFRNAMMIAPIMNEDGDLAFFIGSQLETPTFAERQRRARRLISTLSFRQLTVLREMARGHRNKQIAHSLCLTTGTVKAYRAALMGRLGTRSAADAIRIAVEAGI